ncbi:MAG: fumarylacetoacetate hydrolase family protein [Bryobacteraceae bacterium]|nr:fumarylacetoacetate hydrolase family protein [Bryobacteraceae bacterium]
MKRVRYSFDRNLPATAPDGPEVLYGEFGAIDLSSVRLLPPCAPSKIVCVGRNYAEHARELGNEPPAEPLIFLKPPSALSASGDAIVYPPISERVDWEGELGVVIGKKCRNVTPEEAMDYVLGYTCVNDVTARDLQKKDGQWTRGKGFDTFCAVGPCLVGRNDLDLDSLRVRTVVDGEVKQEAPVTDMIFNVPVIISYISRVMTLEPGDLIATGTPEGVGPVKPGQVMRIEIEGIGTLENPVVKG